MSTWNSRGLRGSFLEDVINRTNEYYRERGIALIQKIPTPITPIEIDKASRHITLAYFDQKSTVDYIGVAQGIPICFDCKECAVETFSLQNVHEHQFLFMKDFRKQEGISFLLIYFSKLDIVYYMRFAELEKFYNRMTGGGRKSIRFDELDEEYKFPAKNSAQINYLEFINKELDNEEV
ncbi:MAG: Holliday junction resolvase RecU [Lachnospiraceae bacterium]|nr:Holliday junction resolvase RecU [Lachnospiraceae bacterium]